METKYVVQCPECQKKGLLHLPSGRGGLISVKCPNCNTTFRQLIERRPYPRIAPYPVVRYGPYPSSGLPHTGELYDISAAGCRVRTKGEIPAAGAWLSLRFKLPIDDSTVQVRGTVVWIQTSRAETEFGFRFTSMDDEAKRILDQLQAGSSVDADLPLLEPKAPEPGPSTPDKARHPLSERVLNAERYTLGSGRSHVPGPPPRVPESGGVLNLDRYALKSFKSGLLNPDRYTWKSPHTNILNAGRYGWKS